MSHALHVDAKPVSKAAKVVRFAFSTYLRLLAVCFFALALYTWVSAIGIWEGDGFRFDTMTTQERIFQSILLVLHPVAAVGLWTTLSWGRVIWILALTVQVIAIMRFGVQPPFKDELLLFHAGSLVLYVVFEILVRFVANKA